MKNIFSADGTIRQISLLITSAIILLFSFPASLHALDVLVIKSSAIKPYQDAIDGFKKSCACTIMDEVISQDKTYEDIRGEVDSYRPGAILTVGIDAFRTAQELGSIPIVSVMVPFTRALESRNVSGVNMLIPLPVQMAAILDIFPGIKNIGMLGTVRELESHKAELQEMAMSRGVRIIMELVYRTGDVPALIDGMKGKVDLLWMIPDIEVINEETVRSMILFSFQYKVPIFSFSKKYVEMGAVATLQVDPYDMGVQAGEILRNREFTRKGSTPVRMEARNSRLIINKKMVKKMGLRVNEAVLKRAADVE